MTDTPPEPAASPVEPGNTESKEAAFLRDVAVVKKLQAELEAAIAAIPASEPPIYRRGWTDIAYSSGYTSTSGGQLQYAVEGDQIFIRGGAHRTAGDFTSGTDHVVASIPIETPEGVPLRPLANHRYSNWGSLGRTGRIEIQPDGDVIVKVPDDSSSRVTTETNIVGVSGDTPHSHEVDLENAFQWMGLSTTYLTVDEEA